MTYYNIYNTANDFLSNDTVTFVILSQTSCNLHFCPHRSRDFHLVFMPNRFACLGTKSRTPLICSEMPLKSPQTPRMYICTTEAKTRALRCLKTSR